MVKRQGSGIRAQGSGCSADTNPALAPLRPLAEPWALGPDPCAGFTLVELMVVMAIIAILATIAIPSFTANVKHAREAVLREDLFTMPQSLDDLVQSGYLREMPKDPFTHRTDTWIPDEGSILTTLDETAGGIDNVHSGSQDVATDGTTYNTW
jgi:general secretion pathway protein G